MAEVAPLRPRETAPLGPAEPLAVDRIEAADRLRPVDPDWVAFMASELAKNGLGTPIWVRWLPGRGARLVAGAHRLAAARSLGWETIQVQVFRGDADQARMWEIAENLVRRDLGALDRAAFTAELYELERKRAGWEDGRSAHAAAADRRWAKDASANLSKASELEEAVAAKVGLSERSIRRQLELHRGLDARVRASLAGLPVTENAAQLRLLARQPAAVQLRIGEWLRTGDVQTVGQGVDRIQPRAPADPADKRLSAFVGAFARAGGPERRELLRAIEKMLPRGVALDLGGAS